MEPILLKGITWGHSRGISPLVAISQRFTELNPNVQILWDKRSLQEFADFSIEKLTNTYDLLIIDHPWVGCAASTNCVLPLNEYLSASYLENQEVNSVGGSHSSYFYDGKQWALAIDAAAPVASFRKDLLLQNDVPIPEKWGDVLSLAKMGKVALPAIPIDLLMNFYSFCIAHGNCPFKSEDEVIDRETGLLAIAAMKELYSLVDKKMYHCNPIAVAELMTTTDDYWYCPFAYGYSNYSRAGYCMNLLTYGDVVEYNGSKIRTTIGGTGLAVSASSRQKKISLEFAEMIVSPQCQQTMYVQHGGQPGHRQAWLNEDANKMTNQFFKNILPVLDNGYVRPRYNGYLFFQDHAGKFLQECILNDSDALQALKEMNALYVKSLFVNKSFVSIC